MNVYVKMAVDKPTNTDFTTASLETSGREGWLELTIPHAADIVGTISFRGGISSTQSTHDDLGLDDAEIYINGPDLQGTAFTGITWASTAPGTLVLAAAQAADARIRIPVINPPPYISVYFNNTSGGSAVTYIQATWFFREEAY